MRPGLVAFLAFALLAGCLESPGGPATTNGSNSSGAPPGGGLKAPTLTADVLYRLDFGFGPNEAGARNDTFVVPLGVDALAFDVTMSAGLQSESPVVYLVTPSGEPVAKCGASRCGERIAPAPAGVWTVAYVSMSGHNGTVVVRIAAALPTPTPSTPPTPTATPPATTSPTAPTTPTPATPPPATPEHRYVQSIPLSARTNHTDFVLVLPGETSLKGVVVFDQVVASPEFPPRVAISNVATGDFFSCDASCTLQREIAPGLYRVGYEGNGTGTLYANFTLVGDATPTTSYDTYSSSHDYRSWPNRAAFDEGFLVPPGMARLEFDANWDAGFDAGSNATVELRDPTGAMIATCAVMEAPSCTHNLDAPLAGLWQVWYLGGDGLAHVRTHAKVA